jgi:two-component system, NarL family, nitrate/nitrite response regulator NarL
MVLLASPSRIIRNRWQRALTGFCPTHEVAQQFGLRQALSQYKPAVLLLDSDLIQHRGTRQLSTLLQTNPLTRIIFFTDHFNDAEAIAVLKGGARGYCAKKTSGALLKKAVQAVKKGEFWIGRRLIPLLIESLREAGPGRNELSMRCNKPHNSAVPLTVLSPRELDVASMIGTGEQNKIISSHLSISEKTVKAHLTNIFKKLGFSSRTQLALFVRQNHSISNSSTTVQSHSISLLHPNQ